jgi:uncharacterized protein
MGGLEFLKENERRAVDALKGELEARFDVREIRVFGSKSRGEADADADLDVMIQLGTRSPEIESEIDDITFEINLRNDSFITTVVLGESELEQGPMKESPIYKIISGGKESPFDRQGKPDPIQLRSVRGRVDSVFEVEGIFQINVVK